VFGMTAERLDLKEMGELVDRRALNCDALQRSLSHKGRANRRRIPSKSAGGR